MPDPKSYLTTRRQFLGQAGGVSFLALATNGRGLFASPLDTSLPLFTALPYIQAGTGSSLLIPGREMQTVAWQTDHTAADFTLEYGRTPQYGKKATITRTERAASLPATKNHVEAGFNYAASLTNLDLSTRHYYRLRGNGKTIAEGEFTTRKKRGEKMRFVSFGDNANGSAGERAIAYQAYKARPDFIMNTGDNVYGKGLNHEYVTNFFPVYNADHADPNVGSPLLRSVPFYTVIANHDVAHKDVSGNPIADFDQDADSLGYYTNIHLPLNGPQKPAYCTPYAGASESIKSFLQVAGPRYPRMANYSFDYGDVHFLCLDSNIYVDPTDSSLQAWITADLKATNAAWKFVVYHHPAFNVGEAHYRQQHMRVLSPIFEAHGVDFCLSGHEHVYQRAMPLRFEPKDLSRVAPTFGGDRRLSGNFKVDREFDGKSKTKPDGILYVTTGAGGASLYDPGYDHAPEKWVHPDDANLAYVTRFVSSEHSCSIFDVSATELTMTQVGEQGSVLDTIRVTKSA